MRVLLSIKPEFAYKIFEGSKRFEFRKAIFKNQNISTIVVYASSPVQKVIGEFEIESIIKKHPKQLWKNTKQHSGITESFFFKYFEDRDIAYAIKIKSYKKYDEPKCLKTEYNSVPPQSFKYLS